MLEEFEKYISGYDLDEGYIKLKHDHSVRVMELMVKYAKELGYSDDDIELAKIIGLLHDIGRFEQYKVFGSDDDHKTIDHADYSVVQLFDKGEIKLFTDREEWYPVIKFAIQNHNKREIASCDDELTLKMSKLIRDADKIDIIYLFGIRGELDFKVNRDEEITDKVREYVFRHETVNTKDRVTCNDKLVTRFAFVFDVVNDVILPEYKKYLEAYYERVEDDGRMKEIYEEIIKYVDERIDIYERNRN